ncbi:MAG: protein kinase [Candidatus Riflebacteria bacterium]|nr:protein kinase [Candidatus Riflebacteria bacterium]
MIGELINEKYKIEAAFSESHMYEIFSALEVATGTRVVIKILKEEMAANPERVRGFSDEIKSFAGLSHPLIAEVLDVDMYDDRPYVVSTVVNGKDLHSLIKESVLPLNDCIRIIQDIAAVLQYACDQKIEHRTIKLSNVLRRDDGHLSILSFTHPRLKLASRTTRSEGSGIHSDLFFLGSTFFELLAGESPIRKRGGINELWDMKLEKLLRIRHPEMMPEQLSRVVDFVRRTLTREMGKRFNSHEEFLKALADLSGTLRETNIRSRSRQLSMASQVVDALNGRMSNVNTSMPPVVKLPVSGGNQYAAGAASLKANGDQVNVADETAEGYGHTSIEGNLALVVDNSGRDSIGDNAEMPAKSPGKKHLRLVKPVSATSNASVESGNAWKNQEERHWLQNPVIFMGLCLVAMVFLILFW